MNSFDLSTYKMEGQTMKPTNALKLILPFIVLLFVAVQSFSAIVPKETVNTIQTALQEQVKHPGYSVVKDNSCCADVLFTITPKGTLIVKRIITDNDAIADYLKEKLGSLSFGKMKSPVDQLYRVKISFKLI